jgi:hypothetical protein
MIRSDLFQPPGFVVTALTLLAPLVLNDLLSEAALV